MYQTEIKFFWPLTEQIPLDLDYANCERPSLSYPLNNTTSQAYTISNGGTWTTMQISGSQLNLDVEEIKFKMKKEPGLLRKLAYKVLGLKWELR